LPAASAAAPPATRPATLGRGDRERPSDTERLTVRRLGLRTRD
jgi:hypothetical protein